MTPSRRTSDAPEVVGRRPRVGSLFAGVEGFGQGLEQAGFEVAWQVEIDKDAVSVLERHYPTTPRIRDVREAGAHNLAPIDVLTFGSPCQGFSVAGAGKGLEDERSGLFGEAVRIIRELRPAFAIWENVPGAFSANAGRDFGAVLAALAESGAVDISWRVLDAQWFGVPQRRRHIFLVADFGTERAAQILFESEGSSGDLEACGEAGQGRAGDVEDGAGIIGVISTLNSSGAGTARPGGQGAEPGFYIPECFAENYDAIRRMDFAPTISARHGLDPLQNGVISGGIEGAHGQNIARAVNCQQGIGDPTAQTFLVGNLINGAANSEVSGTLTSELAKGNRGQMVVATPLTAGGHPNSTATGRHREDDQNLVALAFSVPHAERQPAGVTACLQADTGETGNMLPAILTHSLTTRSGAIEDGIGRGTPRAASPGGTRVRRLTQRECERLMGWPDDWTRYRADGSEIPDGPRYRLIGNGVVASVARWIGERLIRVMRGDS